MSWATQIRKLFRDPAGTSGSMADPAVRALRDAATDAQRSRLPQMAAALSFRTIFGMIPVLVVGLVIAGAVMDRSSRREFVKRALDYTGISAISVHEGPGVSIYSQQESAPDTNAGTRPPSVDQATLMGPETPPELTATSTDPGTLERVLTEILDRGRRNISLKAVGWIGVVTLLYAAIAMLVEIERAFNQVFRVPRGRSWVRRIVNYWAIITLGGLGLILTFYIGAQFETWARNISESRGWVIGSGALTVQLIGYGVTVCISTLMLTLLYASVPNTRVKPVAAITGAFVSALLWEAGKFGFQQYIAYSTGYAKLYGSLALVPLFLLWIYYTWLIVLFGLEVTYQLQHGRLKTRPQPLSDSGPVVVEPTGGLLVMTAITRAMTTGTPQSVHALSLTTGLSDPAVSLIVSRLAERGLLLRVEGASGRADSADPLYTLARTPGSIRIAEILSIGFELAGGPESNPTVAKLRQAQIDAAGSETLAEAAGLTGDSPNRLLKSVQNPAEPGTLLLAATPENGSTAARPATLSS